jgi:hypothetical protein
MAEALKAPEGTARDRSCPGFMAQDPSSPVVTGRALRGPEGTGREAGGRVSRVNLVGGPMVERGRSSAVR